VNNFVVFNAFFTQHRRSSVSKQRNDSFRRPELTSWLLPSEKQQQLQRNERPFSEKNENNHNPRLRTLSDENDVFKNRRQATTIVG
jgi:hypothetical protein